MAGVSGERMGAELRLLLEEPQPAALQALARYAPALLPGLDPDPARIAAALAAAPDDARRDLLALAAAWPPDDDDARGARLHRRRPPHPRGRRPRARAAGRARPRRRRPRRCAASCGASPSRPRCSPAGSRRRAGSPSGATRARRSRAPTCSLRGWRARRSVRGSRRRRRRSWTGGRRIGSRSWPRRSMQRDACHHEADAEHLDRRRDLRQHDDADHGRRRGEERDEQRVRRARQARHRELVADVRDHGGGEADADARRDRHGVVERGHRVPERERRHRHERGDHRRREPVQPAALRHAVAEHDVEREERGVGEREGEPERLALEPDPGERVDAADGEQRARRRCARVRAPSAASAITGRNSIAATVASGSRSIAR